MGEKKLNEKTYEVSLYCDDMQYPEVATLTIEARTARQAIKWVKDNMRYSASEA